jgi:hypothetical protein
MHFTRKLFLRDTYHAPSCGFVPVPSFSHALNTTDPRGISPPWMSPFHNMHLLGPHYRRLRRSPMTISSACCRRARC